MSSYCGRFVTEGKITPMTVLIKDTAHPMMIGKTNNGKMPRRNKKGKK